MSKRILCVDDDANLLAGLQRNLRKQFQIDIAEGGPAALAAMEANGPYAVAVVDMRMPEMDGLEVLRRFQTRWPDTVRIMLTGNADQQTAADAINQGHIFQFLSKPCSSEVLAPVLSNALSQYRLITAERELLENTLAGAVKTLTDILSIVDPQSFGRGELLRQYVRIVTGHFAYPQRWRLEVAAMLAQLGAVSVPDSVSKKARTQDSLRGEEKDMLLRIPQISADLVQNIPRLEEVAQIIRYQNKQYDGGGLPHDTTKGDEIPIGARILKVLGDLIEFESKGFNRASALECMQKRIGWYDPSVLDAAFVAFDVYLPKPSIAEQAPCPVKPQELRSGQKFSADVTTVNGILLVAAETVVTPLLIDRLTNFARIGSLKQPLFVHSQ